MRAPKDYFISVGLQMRRAGRRGPLSHSAAPWRDRAHGRAKFGRIGTDLIRFVARLCGRIRFAAFEFQHSINKIAAIRDVPMRIAKAKNALTRGSTMVLSEDRGEARSCCSTERGTNPRLIPRVLTVQCRRIEIMRAQGTSYVNALTTAPLPSYTHAVSGSALFQIQRLAAMWSASDGVVGFVGPSCV